MAEANRRRAGPSRQRTTPPTEIERRRGRPACAVRRRDGDDPPWSFLRSHAAAGPRRSEFRGEAETNCQRKRNSRVQAMGAARTKKPEVTAQPRTRAMRKPERRRDEPRRTAVLDHPGSRRSPSRPAWPDPRPTEASDPGHWGRGPDGIPARPGDEFPRSIAARRGRRRSADRDDVHRGRCPAPEVVWRRAARKNRKGADVERRRPRRPAWAGLSARRGGDEGWRWSVRGVVASR